MVALQKLKLSLVVQLGLLAVLAAAILRVIPVILAWPFPVGYDTTAFYIPLMVQPQFPSLHQFFAGALLLQIILMIFYRIYPNPFGILNAFAIVLQSLLAFSVFVYGRRVAQLKPIFAFLVSVVFSFNLLTLRLTWDQYRISFSLICAIFAFVFLKSKTEKFRYAAIPFTIASALFNPLPTALLALCIIMNLIFNHKEISSIISSVISAVLGLFLIAIQYSTQNVVSGATALLVPIPGLEGSVYGLKFLIYAAWPLLIFIPLLLLKRQREIHLYWFYVIIFFALVAPLVGVFTISSAWLLWLTGFSLAIIFGQTLAIYQNSKIVKVIGAILLISTVSISLIYVTSSPLQPRYLPSLAKGYSGTTPSGYIAGSVAISQEGKLMQLLNSSISTLSPRSVFLLPQDFYGLALTFPNPGNLNLTQVEGTSQSKLQDFNGSKGDYIMWYNGPPPQNFVVAMNNTAFAVFLIQ
jgi:hypothetical protein